MLRITNGGDGEVFFVESGNIAFADEGIDDAAWGRDSTFVVWLNFNEDDPRLSIMYAYERDWDSIQLEQPGVLLPAGPELLMVPS